MDQRENREKWNNKCFLLLCVLLCGLLFLTACDLQPLKDVIDRMPVLGQDARPSEETVTQPQPEETTLPEEETTEPQPEAESTLPEETTEPEETTLPEEIRLEDVFVLADTANTSEKYNIPFTVGTKGGIQLGTLFGLLPGKTLDMESDIIVTVKDGELVLSTTVLPANSDPLARWTEQTITIPENITSCEISISGGKAKSLSLAARVVSGAYNVEDAQDWIAAPNGVSIAILRSFTLPETNLTELKTGAGAISKSLGKMTVYGNLNTVFVPTFTVKAAVNSYFLYSTDATLQDVVIEGPSYGSNFAVLQADGSKTGTFVSGVEASSVTIRNSYISGFRQPLRVNGGTVTITDSVLNGGNLANIYVHGNTNFHLTNVKTIQFEEDGVIGVGIFLNNTATDNVFHVSDFTQETYMTKAQVQAFIKRILGSQSFLISIKESDLQKFAAIKHGEQFHCGIILCGDNSAMSELSGNVTDVYVRSETLTKGILFVKSHIAFYAKPSCTQCDHTVVTNYTAKDFIATK